MSEKTKSLIRHALTAIGFVLGLLGLNKYVGVVDLFTNNLDSVWSAVLTIGGFATAVIGFFKNKERFAAVFLFLFFAGAASASSPSPGMQSRLVIVDVGHHGCFVAILHGYHSSEFQFLSPACDYLKQHEIWCNPEFKTQFPIQIKPRPSHFYNRFRQIHHAHVVRRE